MVLRGLSPENVITQAGLLGGKEWFTTYLTSTGEPDLALVFHLYVNEQRLRKWLENTASQPQQAKPAQSSNNSANSQHNSSNSNSSASSNTKPQTAQAQSSSSSNSSDSNSKS